MTMTIKELIQRLKDYRDTSDKAEDKATFQVTIDALSDHAKKRCPTCGKASDIVARMDESDNETSF